MLNTKKLNHKKSLKHVLEEKNKQTSRGYAGYVKRCIYNLLLKCTSIIRFSTLLAQTHVNHK